MGLLIRSISSLSKTQIKEECKSSDMLTFVYLIKENYIYKGSHKD